MEKRAVIGHFVKAVVMGLNPVEPLISSMIDATWKLSSYQNTAVKVTHQHPLLGFQAGLVSIIGTQRRQGLVL